MTTPLKGFERRRLQQPTVGPSRAQQHFREQCDINTIMSKYRKTGVLSHITAQMPTYLDLVSDEAITGAAVDYQTALNMVIAAGNAFDALPAQVRKRFDNDPAKFLEFADDPANRDELVSLGLATPRPVEPDPDVKPRPAAEPAKPEAEPTQ
jgi:phage internal scaffolding protein